MTGKNANNKTRHVNNKTQTSTITGLYPYIVLDRKTGDIITEEKWGGSIRELIKYVALKTTQVINDKKSDFISAFENENCPSQPTGIAHTYHLSPDVSELGKDILAKSRIKELIEHKSVSEFKAYWENDNPLKQEPVFTHKINLGAVNAQMANLIADMEHSVMVLSWKCWDKDIDLFFVIPSYVTERSVQKITKPTVRLDDDEKIIFDFSFVEELSYQINSKNPHCKRIVAAYDLGRVKPFVLSIVTDTGKVVATRQASPRLKELNDKRERILENKKSVYVKRDSYLRQHKHADKIAVLDVELENLADKARRLGSEIALQMGHEIASLCRHHRVDVVAGEDLSWVCSEHGSSRWVHGQCEDAVSHAVRREGVKHHVVSPAFSSQECSCCNSRNTWLRDDRVLVCRDCGFELDKDDSASIMLARRRASVEFRGRLRVLDSLRCVV